MNPDDSEPFRPFKTFPFDILEDRALEALEEIAKRDGITVKQVIWRLIDQWILRETNRNN
jgi:hypothetical protein